MIELLLTGSQMYGCPDEKSDIDIVVFIEDDNELWDRIIKEHTLKSPEQTDEEVAKQYKGCKCYPLRLGVFNMLMTNDREVYGEWLEGRDACMRARKSLGGGIDRNHAIDLHRFVRDRNKHLRETVK